MSAGTVYENFFQKRKIRSFFPIVSECLLPAKNFARVAKTAICVSVEVFGEKTFFEIYIIFHTFFGLWSIKRLVGKKIFSRVVTTAIRASRDIFLEKVLLSKKVLFVHLFWSLRNFSCLLTKNSQGVKETTY